MNYNILSYVIYICISIYIIYYVGKLFHQNGRIFILRLFKGNELITDTTNNLLLLAYYLFNIGYSIIQLSFWGKVERIDIVISSISQKTGLLILILAVTHYFNMLLIFFLSKKNKSFLLTKT